MSTSISTIRPPETPKPLMWIRRNLFNSITNSLITILLVVVVFQVLRGSVRWVIESADWRPVVNFPILYLVGQYPRDQLWRIGISSALISLLFGVSWGVWGGLIRSFAISLAALFGVVALLPFPPDVLTLTARAALFANLIFTLIGYRIGRIKGIRERQAIIAWVFAALVIRFVLLPGFKNSALIPEVPKTLWGGLVLTLLLAVGGIIISFPIGILLALGRRSSLPVVKIFCTTFIEVVRGVPLVTILYMFSVILQLLLPPEARIDRLDRALMGMIFFSAAYTAENVRGGLQAVSHGQVEAAQAVGLNNFQITALIVLPQALRAVIPAIVGQFISLFKDTTLVIIVGLNELLGIGKSIINSDPEFIQLQAEVYFFIAFVFWVFSYLMSYASRQLESALGVGER